MLAFSSVQVLCLLLPTAAVVIGGSTALVWTPRPATLSAVQHFTAGLVMGAVAVELVPSLVENQYLVGAVVGFVVGVGFMLGVRCITEKIESDRNGATRNPQGLIIAVATDLAVDGLLVGTTLSLGARQGLLVAVALAIEVFFLALTTSSTLRSRCVGPRKLWFVIAVLAVLLAVGVLVAQGFSAQFSGAVLAGALAFATAALLYLVAEELLVEAHQQEDRPVTLVLFFAGFLLLFVLQRWIGGS